MRWLTQRARADQRADERGAVVILVAFLGVAFLAVAALVIDAGAILQERRELQNGADAAALAVAQSCAVGPSCVAGLAGQYADGNADDSAATVDSVTVDPVNKRVTVVTSTKLANGDIVLPYQFAQAVTGVHGKTVHAQATAKWDFIGRARVIPLVMSFCEWDSSTTGGTVYNVQTTVRFHSGGHRASDCDAQAGHDSDGDDRLPGGFGWVDSTNCEANITAGQLVGEDPGTSAPSDCELSELLDTTVLVPIFDDVNGLGGRNGEYHIQGFGEFHVTGYRFPGDSAGSPTPCSSPTTCIGGYFTRFVSVADAGGGPDLGAYTVSLVS